MQRRSARKSKGFTVIETTIVILIVAGLTVGGWYLWSRNNKQDSDKPSNQTGQNQNGQNEEEPTVNDPSEGGKYLVIEEWGVRFPLPTDQVGDVTYGVQRVLALHGGGGTRQRRHHHYLKGMLWCGECGKRYVIMPGRVLDGARDEDVEAVRRRSR